MKREGFNKENKPARSAHNEPLTLHPSPLTNGAGQRAPLFGWMAHGHVAFTMAEILLSLTIIGVVAAITLPSLTGNINERTWNTQRKALYARMSQAIALMPALNGYGALDATDSNNVAETFITNGLAKVLKINNICGYGTDGSTLFDCGLPDRVITIAASKVDLPKMMSDLNDNIVPAVPNTKAAAFETANGESVLAFYNPNCTASNVISTFERLPGEIGINVRQHVCANFVFDLNGKKGPNTVGKDIGMIAAIYSSDSAVVMPLDPKFLPDTYSQPNGAKECNNLDAEYRMPNIEEMMTLYYNSNLLNPTLWASRQFLWSASVVDATHAWAFGDTTGAKYSLDKSQTRGVVCVKR